MEWDSSEPVGSWVLRTSHESNPTTAATVERHTNLCAPTVALRTIMMSTPAHKQTDPVKKPGQWVNPDVTKLDKLDPLSEFAKARQGTNHDMVDDMGSIGDDAIKAAEYKPTHGGYPSPSTPEERQALKLVVR